MIIAATRFDAIGVVHLALVAAWGATAVSAYRLDALRRLGRLLLLGTALGVVGLVAPAPAQPAVIFALAAVTFHALLALPGGVLDSRGRHVVVVLGYIAAAAAGAALARAAQGLSSRGIVALWVAVAGLALPAAHQRYLRTAGVERQRLEWLGCGAALAAEFALVAGSLHVLVAWPARVALVATATSILLPLAVAASTSQRFVARVDRLLVHTVSLTGLTAVVVGVYFVIVLGLGRVPGSADRQVLALSMIAASIAAVGYVPARNRLTDLANRLVYGERHAPDEVLRTFGSRLTRAIPMDELLLQLAESLRKTMSLSAAEIWTGGGDVLERAVSVPDAGRAALAIGERERPVVARAGVSGNAWVSIWLPELLAGRADSQLRVVPLTHSGELLGLVVAARPPGGDAFGEEQERVLSELARQVALALHNVQLDSALQATLDEVRRQAEELRASRARIVTTGDAERRKIERNLHDGAQQSLVALKVHVRLIKDALEDSPEATADMLDQLANDVQATIQEVRDLAHGIFPQLLLESGLVAALQSAANRNPLDVAIEADGVGRYPPEIEAAVYFCCLEALQNAAKHAAGAHVDIRMREEAGGLLFEVTDNGPGFEPGTEDRGHGYVNMSDRLGAMGGSVRWESSPGNGVSVVGSIPLSI